MALLNACRDVSRRRELHDGSGEVSMLRCMESSSRDTMASHSTGRPPDMRLLWRSRNWTFWRADHSTGRFPENLLLYMCRYSSDSIALHSRGRGPLNFASLSRRYSRRESADHSAGAEPCTSFPPSKRRRTDVIADHSFGRTPLRRLNRRSISCSAPSSLHRRGKFPNSRFWKPLRYVSAVSPTPHAGWTVPVRRLFRNSK
mmetsp:Transcript_18404/g.59482  ORF Transcript_18404/g.59482 Transcript_18404/m.59482 type:complete len:201 (-) Transcript_18404:392-994(-)